jgi:EAL domain-containing protein (putative c-di-GMP-specific phosphodiesterase class I)
MFPEHASDTARLLQCADVAMYAAKRDQTGMALYDAEHDPNTIRNLALSGELRKAIESGQLTLMYQPQVDLRTMKVSGAEVLARWHHPVHGPIPPDEFIAQAEMTGLIAPLTQWVIKTALKQFVQLREKGIEIDLAINLSTKNLQEETLPDVIERYLCEWDIEASRLTLEITESALMHNPKTALATVNRLHALGVRLSIDDFGTGYSSLSYLKRLPLKELKIDKSFVRHMDKNHNDVTIVRSTVDLAHNLKLEVVAEGIESDVHVRMLQQLGCDIGQGYFFSRPLAGEDLRAWIAARAEVPSRPAALPAPKGHEALGDAPLQPALT